MGEIVWAKTHEHRDHLEGHTYGELPADKRTTIFADKNKVCMVDSTMIVGANRSSGKFYYRWRSVSSVGFFRNKAGHLQPYRAVRPPKQKVWNSFYPETAFYYLEQDGSVKFEEPVQAFRDACKRYLHLKSVYDLYPMAEVIGLPERFNLLPANLRPHMRTTDWNEYTAGALGKKRATPEMVEAVQKTEPYVLAMAHEFRGTVDDKALTTFVQTHYFDENLMQNFKPHTPKFRQIIKLTDDKSRMKLLRKPLNEQVTSNIKYISDRLGTSTPPHKKYTKPIGHVVDWSHLTSLV